jgi:acetyltransferase-like isoleucine patch superfamily enzyme
MIKTTRTPKRPIRPPNENRIIGLMNRLFQFLARFLPGATSLRVFLHRRRGVKIGKRVWIGYDAVIETGFPYLVSIGDGCDIGVRSTIIAHHKEVQGVDIGNNVTIGLGALVLPGVKIGDGAVVTAGSVVTRSVPPMTVVQGNPAKPIAKCGKDLRKVLTMKEFTSNLKLIRRDHKKQ